MPYRVVIFLLCLVLAPLGASHAATEPADSAIRNAAADLDRYEAQYEKSAANRKTQFKRIRRLLDLTEQRLNGSANREHASWKEARHRLSVLKLVLDNVIAGGIKAPLNSGIVTPAPTSARSTEAEKPAEPAATPATARPAASSEAAISTVISALPEMDFGRYHALVIGNNNYLNLPKLKTAIADATAVAAVLRQRYGYEVTLLIDATRSDILRAINGLRADLTEDDNLLIYYAGHGTLDRQSDTGYWLPVDAEADNDVDWIANTALTRHLKAMSAAHVLVVADSCYSGTLFRDAKVEPPTGGTRDKWLERMVAKRSRTAITSGGLEPVSDSGGGGHSVFAQAFIDALSDNAEVLEDQALFQRISRPIVINADQTPQFSDIRKAGHDGGAFLFVPKR